MAKIVSEIKDKLVVHFTGDELKHIAEAIGELATSLSCEDDLKFDMYESLICAMAFVNRCITVKEVKGFSDDEAIDLVGRQQARLVKSLIKAVKLEGE